MSFSHQFKSINKSKIFIFNIIIIIILYFYTLAEGIIIMSRSL